MTQTNDDLLPGGLPPNLNEERLAQQARAVSKQNTRYLQVPILINAYLIRDIVNNPQLTAIYGLPGISFIQVSEREVMVSCEHCGHRQADIDDYIVQPIDNRQVPTYTEINGINQYTLVPKMPPLQIMSKEHLNRLFMPIPDNGVNTVTWLLDKMCWVINNP